MNRWLALPALAAALLVAPARAQAPPLLFLGNESVASTDDAAGFGLNPAAGGLRYPSELASSYADLAPRGERYRGILSTRGFGLEASYPRHGRVSYGVSVAAGSDDLRLGMTLRSLADSFRSSWPT